MRSDLLWVDLSTGALDHDVLRAPPVCFGNTGKNRISHQVTIKLRPPTNQRGLLVLGLKVIDFRNGMSGLPPHKPEVSHRRKKLYWPVDG